MVYVILFQPFKTGSRSISIKNEQVPSVMVVDKKYCQTIKINSPTIAPKLFMQILSKLKSLLSNKIGFPDNKSEYRIDAFFKHIVHIKYSIFDGKLLIWQ